MLKYTLAVKSDWLISTSAGRSCRKLLEGSRTSSRSEILSSRHSALRGHTDNSTHRKYHSYTQEVPQVNTDHRPRAGHHVHSPEDV